MSPENIKYSAKNVFLSLVSGILVISLLAVSSCSSEKPSREEPAKTTPPSGPIVDYNFQETSLDRMGVDTDDPQSLAGLGDRYFENGRYQEAIAAYEKVLKLNPNDVDTYNDIGLAYHYTGRSDIAVEKLKKGTEVVPSYQRIWLSLGFVLFSQGRNEEAKPALQKAFELDPGSTVGLEAKNMLDSITK